MKCPMTISQFEISFKAGILWPVYFCLAATAQFISQLMQKPFWHAWRSSYWTLLLTKVPKLHFQLWSWVSLSLGMTHYSSSIIFCTIMFIGVISSPVIEVMLASGIRRLYLCFMSFSMIFWRRSGLLMHLYDLQRQEHFWGLFFICLC